MKTLIAFLLFLLPASVSAQGSIWLTDTLGSTLYPNTIQDLGPMMFWDSGANWIACDGDVTGWIMGANKLSNKPWDTLAVTMRIPDSVEFQLAWSSWQWSTFNVFAVGHGPLVWGEYPFVLKGPIRTARYFTLMVPYRRADGSQNLQDSKVFFGARGVARPVLAGVTAPTIQPERVQWYDVLGRVADTTKPGVYYSTQGKMVK